MSELVNVKLGSNTITGINTIKLQNADNPSEKISFSIGSGGGISGGYTVTFMSQSSAYAIYSVLPGQSIGEPTSPSVTGKSFKGWYSAETGGEEVTFPVTPAADVTYYAQFMDATIIGFSGLTDGADPTPDLIYTDDIASVPKFTTTTSGNYVNVTSGLDDYFPYSQISEYTDASGNTFVKIPKLYMKWVKTSDGTLDGVKISNAQVDSDYFIPDAFLDPKDETCSTYLDYFAIGKYEGGGSTGKMYSKTNQTCLVDLTRAQARTAARSYGIVDNLYKGYQQMDFSMFVVYNFLCMLYFKTPNIQQVYAGRTSASSANKTGSCDGLEGMNGWNTSTQCVKMLGVENPYGNVYKWVDGVMFDGTTIYAHRLPQNFADTTSGGTNIGISRPSGGGFIVGMKPGTGAGKSYCYATNVTGGSATTYYGDQHYSDSGLKVLRVGGGWDYAADAGLWYLDGSHDASRSFGYVGCRLAYRPL